MFRFSVRMPSELRPDTPEYAESLSGLVNLTIKNLFLVYYKRINKSNEIHIKM